MQRPCGRIVLDNLGEQLESQWAWRAKGDEVQDVDRLAADYTGPCNHGKDFKVPEGQ